MNNLFEPLIYFYIFYLICIFLGSSPLKKYFLVYVIHILGHSVTHMHVIHLLKLQHRT